MQVEKSVQNKNFNHKYIQSNIEALIPFTRCHLYGSHRYGLADENSDLNIYIELGECKIFSYICACNNISFFL